MRQILHNTLLGISLAVVSASASAHDFEYADMYFNITNKTAKTVEVTYKGESCTTKAYYGGPDIPESVIYNNVKYTVTSIGTEAFSGCEISGISMPNTIKTIGDNAFSDCTKLTNIVFSKELTNIGESAFEYCTALAKITIPDKVTTIGTNAFIGCTDLSYIWVPASVTSIGKDAFTDTKWLDGLASSVYIHNTLYIVKSDKYTDKTFTIKDGTTKICDGAFSNCKNLTSIVIPTSVTTIGEEAFANCQGLTSFTLDKNIKSVGKSAFTNCQNLKTITINASISEIPYGMFNRCLALEKIIIPNGVKTIGTMAFYNCSALSSVYISGTTTSIGDMAFAECKALSAISSEPATPPTLGTNVFLNVDKSIPVTVQKSSLSKYKSASLWKDFTNFIGGDLTAIDNITISDDAQPKKIYTTSGQRLSAPVKGINIINGKKYFVR